MDQAAVRRADVVAVARGRRLALQEAVAMGEGEPVRGAMERKHPLQAFPDGVPRPVPRELVRVDEPPRRY